MLLQRGVGSPGASRAALARVESRMGFGNLTDCCSNVLESEKNFQMFYPNVLETEKNFPDILKLSKCSKKLSRFTMSLPVEFEALWTCSWPRFD